MKRVVVLGGGVGGSVVANVLAKKAGKAADIIVVDKTGKHVYQPGFVYVAFGKQKPHKLIRDERKLLRQRVKLLIDEAIRIDPEEIPWGVPPNRPLAKEDDSTVIQRHRWPIVQKMRGWRRVAREPYHADTGFGIDPFDPLAC